MKREDKVSVSTPMDAEWVEKRQQVIRQETIDMFRTYRKTIGLTQSELGKKAGISQPNITRFERGTYNPSLDFMVKIASAMGKSVQISFVDE